ncbi:MAG: tungsten ABC transporter substrate-binding protein [Chloroflexi bacterium]|nr:tungsten ABC transporter substrate-binding protein [Chloroflexota bacterium]MBM3173805.1 tungsten ABC transporter substrate-binding protein [Chloroflexota bacterium]MBM3176219.1 tungsten ABC transporter substrate-binding protein [Chloroflexota bacterium]MBM4450798.1 tungsten ABC transporter substrate-binding protein [Chloroflexota bacterium]
MPNKTILRLLILLISLSLLLTVAGCTTAPGGQILSARERLRVATTTSLYDTGLWGLLEPIFEKKYNVELDVLYAGSGIALEYGKRGDVDVITVHDKAREQQFVAEGYGIERIPFAYNYFLIVGPASDPAGIKGMKPEDAFNKLADGGAASFISRGDESGTHARERAIWKSAGFDYEKVRKAGSWYIEGGKGMGPTLLMANEKQGYTLTDAATFLAFKGKLNLIPIVDKGSILLNVYSVIPVNPEKNPKVALNAQKAKDMVSFLTSPEIQKLIGDYGVKTYGTPLFIPCAGKPEPTE